MYLHSKFLLCSCGTNFFSSLMHKLCTFYKQKHLKGSIHTHSDLPVFCIWKQKSIDHMHHHHKKASHRIVGIFIISHCITPKGSNNKTEAILKICTCFKHVTNKNILTFQADRNSVCHTLKSDVITNTALLAWRTVVVILVAVIMATLKGELTDYKPTLY
jgi:hypothetical protein